MMALDGRLRSAVFPGIASATSFRIPSLDAIRGIAAMVVVVFHILVVLPQMEGPSGLWLVERIKTWPLRLLWGGEEAVLVFFVLSGFVLALPFLGSEPPRWTAFAVKRVIRLYPTYLVALLAAAAAMALLSTYHIEGLSENFHDMWHVPLTMGAVMDGALMVTSQSNINFVFWSLVHEMRISLFFWPLFAVTMRLGAAPALVLFTIFSVAAAYLMPLIPFTGNALLASQEFLKTVFFMDFFVLGVVLASQKTSLIHDLSGRWQDFRITLFVFGIGLMGLRGQLPYAIGHLCVGFGFALLILVILSTPKLGAALNCRLFLWLGNISYSLYLSHAAVIHALFYVLHDRLPTGAIMVIALPATLLAGWILWIAVERPSLLWSRRAMTGCLRQ